MSTHGINDEMLARYKQAAEVLAERAEGLASSDAGVVEETRVWIEGQDEKLPWQNPQSVTADEYFFISTLYGNMNPAGQRTMIRKYFHPLFVEQAGGDIRKFGPDTAGYDGLRSPWMKQRLCKMGEILRFRDISMQQYVDELRLLEEHATPENPTPALDKIVHDHEATGEKTLGVFVRDYVPGNSFPIDLRVERQLIKFDLPINEKKLVRMCLTLGRNPRQDARNFYEARP